MKTLIAILSAASKDAVVAQKAIVACKGRRQGMSAKVQAAIAAA
jgi:hypothetical protein